MVTGELKNKIDRIWDAFWTGGIANPLEVIEQITYLLFIRRLDDLQFQAEFQLRTTGSAEQIVFPEGDDQEERPYSDLRWSVFKNLPPERMFYIVSERVFPFMRQLGGDGSTYSQHMRNARFTIPTPNLLDRVIAMIDKLEMDDRDTKGDLYEYMLSKIATAGQNGQFRTPRHLIQLIVAMTAPTLQDEICDPACGTAGFLVAAGDYLRREHGADLALEANSRHFHNSMFHGFDFDSTMLRIGSMNMLLHGVDQPDIRYRDSLAESVGGEEDMYTLILANPPFAGSLDYESTAKDLLSVVKTKKTELLFIALFVKLLQPGGRGAVIVPEGVLFGSTGAHKGIRKMLVEEQHLQAVVKLPAGVFRPYAGVSTAVLFFQKTDIGGTDHVWFYDMRADGLSLDDKRAMQLDEAKFGPFPEVPFTEADHEKNNLPDVLRRWQVRDTTERGRPRAAQSFCVPKAEIVAEDYDLSINRYKETPYEEAVHRPVSEILGDLERLEAEIQQGMSELKSLLG